MDEPNVVYGEYYVPRQQLKNLTLDDYGNRKIY
jgi:hypothetical protein